MTLTIGMGNLGMQSKVKDKYHARFLRFQKLPKSSNDLSKTSDTNP